MRGKQAKKRKEVRDFRYNDTLVARFINKIMQDGKKKKAEKIFYEVIESAAKELDTEPVDFVNEVVDNIRPSLEIKARRVGGSNYQVPVPVTPVRQETLAVRWLISAARAQKGKDFSELLKKEMVDAYNNEGSAIRKKTDTEKMAEANKAFAHFRW